MNAAPQPTRTPDEEVIDPARPIIDPHHHLWHRAGDRYLLDELLADTGAADAHGARHNVRSTVYVECASMYSAAGPEALRPVGETEFVQGVAAMSASGVYGPTRVAAGIVSFADLCLGAAVREVLEAHIDAARNRFRGIRHAAGWHASEAIRNSHSNPVEGLLLDKSFREGFAQLAPLGLSFDAWLFHPQLTQLTDLARAFPDTVIVLDHFGGPLGIGPYAGDADAVFADWHRDIDELAACPNVVAKLGGLAMPINGFGWHKWPRSPSSQELADATARYVLHTIDRFGPQRCMFESNFPVDKVSCSYRVLWNSFKRLAAGFSDSEKDALFHDTAARVYRLAPTE
ncbi:MAG: amidohydrolase family protein [Rubrivivax sp.]